jgi:hypothetical protein
LISAVTPEVEIGSGTADALCVAVDSCDPNTLRIEPGAKLCLKLAPLATLVIAGVPPVLDPDAVTFTVTDAVPVVLYAAVIVSDPTGSCVPFTTSVAVAVPADPVNTAVPSEFPPAENAIDPVGDDPSEVVTVAVRYTTWLVFTVLKLLSKVTVSAVGGGAMLPPSHPSTSLYSSTDPSPVA